jgi:hypothetical protein
MDAIIFMKVALLVFVLLLAWNIYDFKKLNKGE